MKDLFETIKNILASKGVAMEHVVKLDRDILKVKNTHELMSVMRDEVEVVRYNGSRISPDDIQNVVTLIELF